MGKQELDNLVKIRKLKVEPSSRKASSGSWVAVTHETRAVCNCPGQAARLKDGYCN